MLNKIAFIGGIHGVGKSTVCQKICGQTKLEYLSASQLLKWKDINEDAQNKKVKDISDAQNRLIIGLVNTVQKEKYYLLDGHYCLLNINNEITNVPLETFKQINPMSLNIILGDIIEIKNRLETRDNKYYDQALLKQMQELELSYAKQVSEKLGLSLNIGTAKDFTNLLTSLNKILA